MIDSIDIQNFRGFEQIDLNDLRTINVIAGENASGKTALLEAIYLTAGGPAITFKLKAWRGLGDRMLIPLDEIGIGDVWRDFFYQFEKKRTAKVTLKGSDDVTRSLAILYQPDETLLIPPNIEGGEPSAPIQFEWYVGDKLIKRVRPKVEGEQIKLEGAPEAIAAALYSSATPLNAQENATWFSNLSKRREDGPFIQTITDIFPFISGLSILTQSGVSMVHADIKNLNEKIPLGLVSGGINKLFGLLVAIANRRIIMVDEIENGFYHGTMADIWKAIYKFATQYDAQIFASTHSLECLNAAADLVEKYESDFCFLRARRKNGKCGIEQFNGKSFRAVLDKGAEIR